MATWADGTPKFGITRWHLTHPVTRPGVPSREVGVEVDAIGRAPTAEIFGRYDERVKFIAAEPESLV